jgi:hypothetical protein
MVCRTIDAYDFYDTVRGPVENREAEEELTPVKSSHLENRIAGSNQHTPRVTVGRKPKPEELVANLQTTKLRVREILFDSFLEKH